MSILVIERVSPDRVRSAVLENGFLCAYEDTQESAAIHEGQIYAGVADRAVKSINAVFVRLPGDEYGFLPLNKGERAPASGKMLMVQVKRPPNQSKKAFLTRDIALDGDGLILLPFGKNIGVSSRITDSEQRQALYHLGAHLQPDGMGLILRAAALDADESRLREEEARLIRLWHDLEKSAVSLSSPRLLWDRDASSLRLYREEKSRLESILTNDLSLVPADSPCEAHLCEHPFLLHTVDHKLEKSRRHTVQLKSGATLVVNRCEAMTVIDVNTACASGSRDIEATAEKINLEAAAESARLIRLLGFGGMILIDFIDMKQQEAREHLLSAMREYLRLDPVKAEALDITPLGIMEITRRRVQTPLSELPDAFCPYCNGSGLLNHSEENLNA